MLCRAWKFDAKVSTFQTLQTNFTGVRSWIEGIFFPPFMAKAQNGEEVFSSIQPHRGERLDCRVGAEPTASRIKLLYDGGGSGVWPLSMSQCVSTCGLVLVISARLLTDSDLRPVLSHSLQVLAAYLEIQSKHI